MSIIVNSCHSCSTHRPISPRMTRDVQGCPLLTIPSHSSSFDDSLLIGCPGCPLWDVLDVQMSRISNPSSGMNKFPICPGCPAQMCPDAHMYVYVCICTCMYHPHPPCTTHHHLCAPPTMPYRTGRSGYAARHGTVWHGGGVYVYMYIQIIESSCMSEDSSVHLYQRWWWWWLVAVVGGCWWWWWLGGWSDLSRSEQFDDSLLIGQSEVAILGCPGMSRMTNYV